MVSFVDVAGLKAPVIVIVGQVIVQPGPDKMVLISIFPDQILRIDGVEAVYRFLE